MAPLLALRPCGQGSRGILCHCCLYQRYHDTALGYILVQDGCFKQHANFSNPVPHLLPRTLSLKLLKLFYRFPSLMLD